LSPVAFADASGDAVMGADEEFNVVAASAESDAEPIFKSPMTWLAALDDSREDGPSPKSSPYENVALSRSPADINIVSLSYEHVDPCRVRMTE
jgi:hypothetical protein